MWVQRVGTAASISAVLLILGACGTETDSSRSPIDTPQASASASATLPSFEELRETFSLRIWCKISDAIISSKDTISNYKSGVAAGIDVASALQDLSVRISVANSPFNDDVPILSPRQVVIFERAKDALLRSRARFINDPALPINVAEEGVNAVQKTYDDVLKPKCTTLVDPN